MNIKPDIYEVSSVGRGCLYVMPRPRSQYLREEVEYFRNVGVGVVISHLEATEEEELGLTKEREILDEFGVEFVSYPIRDRSLPDVRDFKAFVKRIYQKLLNGENVAIHCRAGIGRTGMTSSCLLINDGYDNNTAIDMVAASRGTYIPDTEAQYDFICDYIPE
jgi:protein-tyrosine phosphatase|tara:strand:- start:4637 stop:5125 length:489 start_codon:yes stop_codon:yes gene_type:complete